MARQTKLQGVPARYFSVEYTKAQRNEHFRAIEDLVNRRVFVETFSTCPLFDDDREGYEGGLAATFLISEQFADEYVARIAAAK